MNNYKLLLILLFAFGAKIVIAQNPIIHNQFTADPTARVFGDKVYLYPSHDIPTPDGKGLRDNWFCMEDYHVFSSSNLSDWTDHGVIVSQDKVDWVKPDSYSMWAPDCIERNGKYYFYFPAPAKDTIYGRGFSIGVAIADNPSGSFIPEPAPIIGVHGIDPCVFIDKDGQVYLSWAMGRIFIAKLKDNMLELASETQEIKDLPTEGLKEGPFMFERNGVYYMTYPHVESTIERLEYAISDNPMGPYKFAGVIMDEASNGCWTNHQSIVNFKGQWYLFYHQKDWSPKFDKNRSVRIDSLFFNADGTIQKVQPTLRGVGLTKASDEIQLDRYSCISEKDVTVAYKDTLNYFDGWKTVFAEKDAWIQYNSVDFGKKKMKKVQVKAFSKTGSIIQFRLDKADGLMIAEVKVPKGTSWNMVEAKVSKFQPGIHHLIVVLKDENRVEVDWVKFE